MWRGWFSLKEVMLNLRQIRYALHIQAAKWSTGKPKDAVEAVALAQCRGSAGHGVERGPEKVRRYEWDRVVGADGGTNSLKVLGVPGS